MFAQLHAIEQREFDDRFAARPTAFKFFVADELDLGAIRSNH
jgi:hypothetical protein